MPIYEANYLITSASQEDVRKYEDASAMSARILEWLDTPEGTMAHNPSWGHNLGPFRFEPQSSTLATLIEMAIARKLPLDIEDIQLRGVSVEFLSIDTIQLQLVHQFGSTTLEVEL